MLYWTKYKTKSLIFLNTKYKATQMSQKFSKWHLMIKMVNYTAKVARNALSSIASSRNEFFFLFCTKS